MRLVPTILCGGAGSRLWPVSRELHPKPFICLPDGQSLLQKAFLRGAALPRVEEILTVTNREFFFKITDEFYEVNQAGLTTSYILEPCGRNTAAAVAAAALQVASAHGEEAVLLVLAADHLIADQTAFAQAVAQASLLAQDGWLVTFGIRPDAPETGYGYIEADGHRVLRFVEKPTFDEAKRYLASGCFLWNSGMFCFSAGTILREMDQHCPDVLAATRACIETARRVGNQDFTQLELDPESFGAVPSISIDYAVMERSDRVAVVPCAIGWSDIGSWNALGALTEPDAAGNCVEGEALLHETGDCYIRSDGRLVGAVGVQNLVIVDTPDALLVADKARAQDVKHVFAALKALGHEAHRLHRTVHRPWGTYTVLEEGPGFKIKRVVVKPGAALSRQMHRYRSEHWIVVSGTAKVVTDGRELYVHTNESTYIAADQGHRLSNPGAVDLVLIEVQSGTHLSEDDIVTVEDPRENANR